MGAFFQAAQEGRRRGRPAQPRQFGVLQQLRSALAKHGRAVPDDACDAAVVHDLSPPAQLGAHRQALQHSMHASHHAAAAHCCEAGTPPPDNALEHMVVHG